MPNATNVIPELVKVGIIPEKTVAAGQGPWGTTPTLQTSGAIETPLLIPVEPPDIKEEITHIVDEAVRGVLARDFEAYGGMRQVTGSLSGPFYGTSGANPVTTGGVPNGLVDGDLVAGNTLAAVAAHIFKAFFGGDTPIQIGVTGNYIHEFFAAELPSSLTLQIEDSLTGSTTTPLYTGVMVPKLTLKYNGAEGLLTWEAELLGQRQVWPASVTAIGADKAGKAMIGWQSSVHFGTQALNPTAVGTVLSAEITFEREITLKMGAANQQHPSIRVARMPRVTFSAVVELQSYAVYDPADPAATPRIYSNDVTTDFTDFQDAWTFRFTTVTRATSNITTALADGSLSLPASEAILDVRLHRVSYGESPLVINRGEVSNTMEYYGRALHTITPTYWFGATPQAGSLAGQRVAQVRLINQRVAAY